MKWVKLPARVLCGLLVLFFVSACVQPKLGPKGLEPLDRTQLPVADRELEIDNLGPCADIEDRSFELNSNEGVTVLVHGCYGSAGRLHSLSQVFAFHGQQSVCFSYDDRDSLEKSSGELVTALNELSEELDPEVPIRVVGHSQGGLVSRRATIEERADGLNLDHEDVELITLATPFAGIPQASHCGYRWLHTATLGITAGICRYISGDKWWEITSASDFIREPGTLDEPVHRHIKVVTDERDTCRIKNDRGRCISRDGIFGVEDQLFEPVDRDPRVVNRKVEAGHVEIVGDENRPPLKLIGLLQEEGILRETPEERRAALEALLTVLY